MAAPPKIEPVRITGGAPCPVCGGDGFDPSVHTFLPPRPRCSFCGGIGRVTIREDATGEWVLVKIVADPVGLLFGLDESRSKLVRFDPVRYAGQRRYRAITAF